MGNGIKETVKDYTMGEYIRVEDKKGNTSPSDSQFYKRTFGGFKTTKDGVKTKWKYNKVKNVEPE